MSAKSLSKIYHDLKDTGYLDGVDRLLQLARQLHVPGVTRKTVQEYLKREQAYTLHKPARSRFSRNDTYVAGIDAQWQADLAEMQGIAGQNGRLKYLFTVIDVFSKFAGRCQSNPKTPRQLRRLSGRCSQRRTNAIQYAYRPTRARNSSTRTSRP